MKLSELPVDERIISIFEEQGITELYQYQVETIPYILAHENIVVSAPTASGKSFIAYFAVIENVLRGGKAMYVVPLRALATEKYTDLKKFEKLGIKVALSYGDLDSPEPVLESFDVIVVTSEKADSLLRHRSYWLKELTIVVIDELHLINDSTRGPTLEIILTRFKQFNIQIVCLSATIKNSDVLASWLNARHIKSDFRPIPLKEGIFYNKKIFFKDGEKKKIEPINDNITSLVIDTINEKGQVLIFVNTRKLTESISSKLSEILHSYIDGKNELKEISNEILKQQSEITANATKLVKCIENGVCFHHAGLTNQMRKIIEDNFRKGYIKCIVATPTLAAGINLPARRVIIHSLNRYDVNLGSVPIPVLEIKQMEGRAGRPQYDKFGEAIFIAKNENEKEKIEQRYLNADIEQIYSKLGVETALRKHVLSSIASGFVSSRDELKEFINSTFYGYYYGDRKKIESIVESILIYLQENNLIDGFQATKFGIRVSNLYIDPVSGVIMKNMIERDNLSDFVVLYEICSTPDINSFYLRKDDYALFEEVVEEHKNELVFHNNDYETFLSDIKTASLLNDWISETLEEKITQKYNVWQGDINTTVETSEWLIYSCVEISRIFNKKHIIELENLRQQVKYGIKKELLELVSLKGIGRKRARILFNHGFKTIEDLKNADIKKLDRIRGIGSIIAKNIKEQIEVT